jgi:hypothetical protein
MSEVSNRVTIFVTYFATPKVCSNVCHYIARNWCMGHLLRHGHGRVPANLFWGGRDEQNKC